MNKRASKTEANFFATSSQKWYPTTFAMLYLSEARSNLYSRGRDYTRMWIHKMRGSLGAILEAAYHTCNINFDHLIKAISELTIVILLRDTLRLCPFNMLPSYFGTSYLLTSLDAPCPACIFPALALEPITSPRSSSSFHWRMLFRNKDLGAGHTHCTGVSLLLVPLSGKGKKIYVCTHICMSIYIVNKNHESTLMTLTLIQS